MADVSSVLFSGKARPRCLPPWTVALKTCSVDRAETCWHADKVCLRDAELNAPEAAEWEAHWRRLESSTRGRVFSLYRRHIRARCVARAIRRWFPKSGLFAECGCGSGETSCRLPVYPTQAYVAVDFAAYPLRLALRQPCFLGGVQADIRRLPFEDAALDGVWNLGVMEHFGDDDQRLILREFRRVLKPSARLLLWWPPRIAPDKLLLAPFGPMFPSEPGRRGLAEATECLRGAGFQIVQAGRSWSDCGTQLLIIAEHAQSRAVCQGV